MGLETVTYISDLNKDWPTGAEGKNQGDNHLRNIKKGIVDTFPNITGAVTPTHTELNYVDGVTSAIQGQIDGKASTASPTFTGTVTLPADTSIGTVSATELGYVDGVTSSIQTQLNAKGAIAGQAWTGTHNFTGSTVTVPTATAGDSSTNAASTAFVAGVAFSAALPGQSAATNGMFPKSNGATASWDWPELEINYISTSTSAVAGKHNVITAGGITVTIPTLAAGVPCAFTNASDTVTPILDWGTTKFRGQATPGLMTLDNKSASFLIKGTGDANLGNV